MSSGITSSSWSMDATWQCQSKFLKCLGYWIWDIEKSWKTQDHHHHHHHHHDHLILHLILVSLPLSLYSTGRSLSALWACRGWHGSVERMQQEPLILVIIFPLLLLRHLLILPVHILHHLSHLYFHQPRTAHEAMLNLSVRYRANPKPQTPKPNPQTSTISNRSSHFLISCPFPPPAPVARSPSMTALAIQWCTPLSRQSGTKNLSFNWKKCDFGVGRCWKT